MVWVNNKYYNAKSYPHEAYGGAMCMYARCKKLRRDMARINKERVRLRDESIRLTDEMDDEKRAGGPWESDIAND
jgi:hypothetical protein